MPVKILGRLGSLIPGQEVQALRVPLVTVALGNDADWRRTKIGVPKIAASDLVALLDTGADFCRIDVELAKRAGLEKTGEMESVAANGLKTKTDVFYGQLFFPEVQFTYEGQLPSGPFRSAERFDVILGMDFLRFFYLQLSAKAEIVTLEFVGQ